MSVRLMGAVFELDVAAGEKLVLLAMADHARDDGSGCYPSIELLARKTSQSRRGVQKIMRRLEDAGLIAPSEVSRGGRHCSTEYKLTLWNSSANSEPRSLFGSTQPRTGRRKTANWETPNREPGDAKQRTTFARTISNRHEPSKNLRPLARPSPSAACGNLGPDSSEESQKPWLGKGKDQRKTAATPQQHRFAIVDRLAKTAAEILDRKPDLPHGDLTEELKQWAALEGIPYFDAWPGAATPIEQAITIASERRKTA